MLRAMLAAAAIAVAAVGGASTAAAEPSLVARAGGAGGIATSPGFFLECPAGTYQATSGDCVPSPNSSPSNATAICGDGTYSHSETRSGTCSRHGGVSQWCPCGGTTAPASAVQPNPNGMDPDSRFLRLLTDPDLDHPMVIWNFPVVKAQG